MCVYLAHSANLPTWLYIFTVCFLCVYMYVIVLGQLLLVFQTLLVLWFLLTIKSSFIYDKIFLCRQHQKMANNGNLLNYT